MTATELQKLTPEEKRVAIAEACGAKWYRGLSPRAAVISLTKPGRAWTPCARPSRIADCGMIDPLPDYLGDLNAMHAAEKHAGIGTLGNPQHDAFELCLAEICYQEGKRRSMIHAAAAQRADALLLAAVPDPAPAKESAFRG